MRKSFEGRISSQDRAENGGIVGFIEYEKADNAGGDCGKNRSERPG
jgi:hypothetical protein